jgi:hypothetical protein
MFKYKYGKLDSMIRNYDFLKINHTWFSVIGYIIIGIVVVKTLLSAELFGTLDKILFAVGIFFAAVDPVRYYWNKYKN